MSRSASAKPRFLDRRGQTAIELALVAQLFLALLVGGVEVGRYFFVAESVRHLVGEVARGVIVSPDASWNTTAQQAPFVARASILQASKLTLTVNVVRAAAPALSSVTVTANYNDSLRVPFIPSTANTIASRTQLNFTAP
jgi:Flp pilus assembly protein TadG